MFSVVRLYSRLESKPYKKVSTNEDYIITSQHAELTDKF